MLPGSTALATRGALRASTISSVGTVRDCLAARASTRCGQVQGRHSAAAAGSVCAIVRARVQLNALPTGVDGAHHSVSVVFQVGCVRCRARQQACRRTPLACARSDVTRYLETPAAIADARMRAEVEECLAADIYCSPAVARVRRCASVWSPRRACRAVASEPWRPATRCPCRNIGAEYEVVLEEALRSAGVPFYNEYDLRQRGFAKTPDVLLGVPLLVGGRHVHWIDSKALFGDEFNHSKCYTNQYKGYVNRKGGAAAHRCTYTFAPARRCALQVPRRTRHLLVRLRGQAARRITSVAQR